LHAGPDGRVLLFTGQASVEVEAVGGRVLSERRLGEPLSFFEPAGDRLALSREENVLVGLDLRTLDPAWTIPWDPRDLLVDARLVSGTVAVLSLQYSTVHGDDPWMVEARHRLGLATEPLPGARRSAGEELRRQPAWIAWAADLVDHAHAPVPEGAYDLELPDRSCHPLPARAP
jgi:hypothetical protein